jgi:hypothetical protein
MSKDQKVISERDDKGRFVKGQSGNPAGRAVGVRSKTTEVKEYIENALANRLQDEAAEILDKAVQLAKNGDQAMIKFLLGDVLAEVRRDTKNVAQANIQVVVNNLTEDNAPIITINQEEKADDE